MKEEMSVIFSYIPLLMPEESERFLDTASGGLDVLQKKIKEVEDKVHIEGCLWAQTGENECQPIFIVDNPQLIADHMKLWAENKVYHWFTVQYASYKDGYAIGVFPNIEASVDRNRLTYKLKFFKDPPKNNHIIFKPLAFYSGGRIDAFKQVEPMLDSMDEIAVGLVDAKQFDANNLDGITQVELGTFKLTRDKNFQEYLVNNLKTQEG